jgi:hypothetical protein
MQRPRLARILVVLAVTALLVGLAVTAGAAPEATFNLAFGNTYAIASGTTSTNAKAFTGGGSWYELYPSAKLTMYIDPVTQLGGTFTIDDIQSITYHTLNDGTNPSGVDFYTVLYTTPGSGTACTGSWYCSRLNAEPYLANSYSAPVANVWNTWTTNVGTNQLTFFDSANCGSFGFFGAPTLQDLKTGPINWSSYGAGNCPSPAANPIDYGSEPILYISFQTGSGWTAFEGYLDAITIETTTNTYVIDLESLTNVVWVDDGWVGSVPGVEVAPGKFFGFNAFATVQDGIDNVSAGGQVRVFPGTYSETASNRYLHNAAGPYQFGVFVGDAKAGITIQGVDAGDNAITSFGAAQATINTNATNNFGPSGFFIEGDNVTVAGVRVGTNASGQNKTIEVIGNNFTLKDCDIADLDGSVYLNDWRFDTGTTTSHVQSYTVDGNNFQDGVSLDIASGAGYSGLVSGRKITDNVFVLGTGDFWPSISFTGSDTGVPWFLYSVGGAEITGNQFSGGEQIIRARGTYDNSQFDWASYWNDNTFEKGRRGGSQSSGQPNHLLVHQRLLYLQ